VIERFQRSVDNFEERTGEPDEFSCALGRIAVWFAELEHEITQTISYLLSIDEITAGIVTAELSFRNKLHLLASLVRARFDLSHALGSFTLKQYLEELVARTFEVEQLRNQIMHSRYIGNFLSPGQVRRSKITAKASRGVSVVSEQVDAGYLLDIADFICYIMMEQDTFRNTLESIKPT
jgi:hypothetical protein